MSHTLTWRLKVNKKYMCSCGQVYYSDHGTPMGISWTDGHTCEPEESK